MINIVPGIKTEAQLHKEDPVEAIIKRLPASIAGELRLIQQQVHPFFISSDGQTISLGAVLGDIHNLIGVRTSQETVEVALQWGDTPASIFDQEGRARTYRYLAEYDPNGRESRQQYSVNGRIEDPPVTLEKFLRNCRNSMLLRLNPPMIIEVH